jgi:hypothetical protein
MGNGADRDPGRFQADFFLVVAAGDVLGDLRAALGHESRSRSAAGGGGGLLLDE